MHLSNTQVLDFTGLGVAKHNISRANEIFGNVAVHYSVLDASMIKSIELGDG